jgi:hypothetical protein
MSHQDLPVSLTDANFSLFEAELALTKGEVTLTQAEITLSEAKTTLIEAQDKLTDAGDSLAVLADSLKEHTFSDPAPNKLKLAELESTLQTHTATITALEASLELVEKKASILGAIAAFPTNMCSFLSQNGETIIMTVIASLVLLIVVTGGLALSRRIWVWGLAGACR